MKRFDRFETNIAQAKEFFDMGARLAEKVDNALIGGKANDVEDFLSFYELQRPCISKYITVQFIKDNYDLLRECGKEYNEIAKKFFAATHKDEESGVEVIGNEDCY